MELDRRGSRELLYGAGKSCLCPCNFDFSGFLEPRGLSVIARIYACMYISARES